jgi:hypothetical protein
MRSSVGRVVFATVFAAVSTSVAAQWPKYTTPDVPRLADGQPNLNAPAPERRMASRISPASGRSGSVVADG